SKSGFTWPHELAQAIVFLSPVTVFADQYKYYLDGPLKDLFQQIPTVWDETRVPLGEIGKYAVEARRSGQNWFVGAIGDSHGNNLRLPMKFLKSGVTYDATIYSDDPAVPTATHIAVTRRKVTSVDTLDLALLPSGGEAIYLTPSGRKAGDRK
ncbi:MAG: glycoside hydrolase family 97 C-terminal domain-containing protein, partial [Terracidiphilus sp.]